jgi:hypothetical protein
MSDTIDLFRDTHMRQIVMEGERERAAVRASVVAHHREISLRYTEGQPTTLHSAATLDLLTTLERAAEALR